MLETMWLLGSKLFPFIFVFILKNNKSLVTPMENVQPQPWNSCFNHQQLRNYTQYAIQTYCSPTEFCTGHLWSYSDLHNNDPKEEEEEDGRDDEKRADSKRRTCNRRCTDKRLTYSISWLYLADVTHVAVQFVYIMRTLKEEEDHLSSQSHVEFQICALYLCIFVIVQDCVWGRLVPGWSRPCRSQECHSRWQHHGTSSLSARTVTWPQKKREKNNNKYIRYETEKVRQDESIKPSTNNRKEPKVCSPYSPCSRAHCCTWHCG